MTNNRARLVWPLLLGWVVLALVAVMWAVPNEEDGLAADATAALQAAGIGATVEFDGRDALLSGELAETERARALEVVRTLTGVRQAEWEAGIAAPTTSISGSTTVPPTTAPTGSSSTLGPTTTATGLNAPRSVT